LRVFKAGELDVAVARDSAELGRTAAEVFAAAVKSELARREEMAVVMALGAAQSSFFKELQSRDDIEWSRISVLQIDTYLGVGSDRPESAAARLQRHLLDFVKPRAFVPMEGGHVPITEELGRYSRIYYELNPAICVAGIGDSGHLGFNDPPADFETRELVRVVEIGDATRRQIERARLFGDGATVPTHGVTLTMYAILRPPVVLALVDGAHKAPIVKEVVEGPVTPMCPASLLQRCPNARLLLSEASAALLNGTVTGTVEASMVGVHGQAEGARP
jgi:glucosamine-6-phosphate deaminase